MLSLLLVPVVEESAMQAIERDWHKDVLVMVRDRLPKFVFVLLLLFVLERIVYLFVHRMQTLAERRSDNPYRAAQLRTMTTIVRGASYFILGFLAFLQLLKLLDINYGPLLTSAGILGVGIGLGAQSLFKDIINGIFILVEDQYNVGEVVKIATVTGTVEDLTLRLTRLRDGDGTLYIIPNSQVATVSNLSRDYSVASLPVAVDASANPDHVVQVLNEIAARLQQDASFKDTFVNFPTVLGLDKIDGRTLVYPINFRTRPNQKDPVLRELRRLIVLTFEREGIPLGSDGSLLIMQHTKEDADGAKDPTAPPAQQPLVGS